MNTDVASPPLTVRDGSAFNLNVDNILRADVAGLRWVIIGKPLC